jgi:putative flavoprotein involved in K+ transport
MALAARLRRLEVPTIVLEANARAGDGWRKRYKSLCLHDPVWYDHMPYLPFPDHWPVFSPKDQIADWLEMYAKVMELNYWTSSRCTSRASTRPRRNGSSRSIARASASRSGRSISCSPPAWPACR